MPTDAPKAAPKGPGETSQADKRRLTPEAERALAEAAARRAQKSAEPQTSKEIDGRGGLDPTRYGDWEINGLAADF